LERGNLLLVTSAVPGEGKSFVSLNLALSIAAERDCRVLLVDADPAKARISQLFGAADRAGLTELVGDERRAADSVILDTNVPGLQFLPSGRVDSRSPELFASRRAESCLKELAGRNPDQMIVLDSPPLLATSEAQVLSRTAGQVLLVVRADSTTQSALMHAIALLEAGAKVRCVLNQISSSLFGGHYYAYERR
jgi:capsular exopolysaccharide synthesis family protein